MRYFSTLSIILCLSVSILHSQEPFDPSNNKMRQLRMEFATPNDTRTASGAPGHAYWQQEANYKMHIVLDDEKQTIAGESEITYINNSPDPLSYLWVQLDQNVRARESLASKAYPSKLSNPMSARMLKRYFNDFDGGFKIDYVRDGKGQDLEVALNHTMMRIDLPAVLEPGQQQSIKVKWWYHINDRFKDGGGRSGMEYFPADENYIYTIAQFYPRMAVYNEVEGWQNMQFLGRNEFALPFGNYDVEIVVPSDHVVGATGSLLNPEEVLSAAERKRLDRAMKSTDEVVMIVTPEEAAAAEKQKARGEKTWKFRAENVRDFAFASSRKFIWDGMAVVFGDRKVLATSLYPKEGNPLWEKYSTRVIAHTLNVYSRHTFDYPYPVAYSVHTNQIGMEYPMMAFNGGRPRPDGSYSERTKWGMIGVIIHEVGHNYFPMIVNSDERQRTWMDEGLNTFLQGIAEREWDHNHPSPKGRPKDIVPYMKGDPAGIAPIMVNGALSMQFNNNGYKKPATALNILRETVMGRELFDFAFREYAQRWMFKHPGPEDFFRTMEDASAIDLDWFWRGWFYTTEHVDISLDRVLEYVPDAGDPREMEAGQKATDIEVPEELAVQRNRATMKSVVEMDPSLRDMYDDEDLYNSSAEEIRKHEGYLASLSEEENSISDADWIYYQLDFTNRGGLIMPIIVQFDFVDGESHIERVPAEIWRRNNVNCSKVFRFRKKLAGVRLDPFLETADCDRGNNHWPPVIEQDRFDMYKHRR